MADVVTYSRQGIIGIITVDNPPVNAISHGVRSGLKECVAQGIADADVAAIIFSASRPNPENQP